MDAVAVAAASVADVVDVDVIAGKKMLMRSDCRKGKAEGAFEKRLPRRAK